MKLRFALLWLVVVTLVPHPAHAANEVGFIEKFALAPDREAVLNQLIPGSEDYYFFHALHYQNTRQQEKLTAILDQWARRFPQSAQRRVIENRAALLGYDADPQATLKFLRERLNVQLDHEQVSSEAAENLPTKLDQALISRAVFQEQALSSVQDLSTVKDVALTRLLRDKSALKPSQKRDLLKRLTRPDTAGLLDLVAEDLGTKESRGFGEFDIHRALLPEQLDELAKRLPTLLENQAFVQLRLQKLAPSADADAEFDPAEREAWLDRLWSYAAKLSPSFNSLKANILYQRLQFDRTHGRYDEGRFLEYLKLPRRVGYINPKYLNAPEQIRGVADLRANFSAVAAMALPVGDDERLVRDYFLHLLPQAGAKAGDANAADLLKKWTPYVRDTWLRPVLAEAMITNGIGQPEQWSSLLSPTAFQELKDRVDVDFALTNPPFLAPEDDVSLDLLLKNTPKVIVKIYEINTLAYFLANHRQLNTDLALDGLVANRELTQDFSTEETGRNPFRRSLRNFKFPELKGRRGAWIVEFIGGGKSSRALVRKGHWSLLQHTGPAGDMITVLDEKHEPVSDATVWIDGRSFSADKKTSLVFLPFTQQPGPHPIILADATGEFASLATFEHHGEDYRLDVQFHVEREQLLNRREATIAIRATLLLDNTPVPLDFLKEPKLTLTTTTLDDIKATREIKIEKIAGADAYTCTMQVPDRLASLEAALSGKVEMLVKGGEQKDLSATDRWAVNGIGQTPATHDAHLSRIGDRFIFEALGKNGEPKAGLPVAFEFTHQDFTTSISSDLQTDKQGRIDLGPLDEIENVSVTLPNERHGEWNLSSAGRTSPAVINVQAGEPINLPWTDEKTPVKASLLEIRGNTFVKDWQTMVTLPKAGSPFFTIKPLAPGDYSFAFDGSAPVGIRVTEGHPIQDWLISSTRELELKGGNALNLSPPAIDGNQLVVRVFGASPQARVHLTATRFLPEVGLFNALSGFPRFAPRAATPARLPNLFAAGRSIGDEYRYILERRYSKQFPGSLLPRPGLLLSPWETKSTDLQAQDMSAMERAASTEGGRPAAPPSAPEQESREAKEAVAAEAGNNLDFLPTAAPVLFNLSPDKDGYVRIDRKLLGDRQYIQVYAEDPESAVWREFVLSEAPAKFLDLRLARALNPEKAFTQANETSVLAAGQTLTIADASSADLETYDSLARVHSLFTTLSKNENLAKFGWLLKWPTFSGAEKQAKYSEFACHELNFFLSRKDPAFFQKVILPFLRNKKDRTFLDDYLLGTDLHAYLEPWDFNRLNIAERALLIQRLPAEKGAIARHLRELWEMNEPDPFAQDRLFETALRGHEPDSSGISKNAADALLVSEKSAAGAAVTAGLVAPAAAFDSGVADAAKPKAQRFAAGMAAMVPQAVRRELPPNEPMLRQPSPALAHVSVVSGTQFSMSVDELQSQRQKMRAFFRALGPTKEWAENNYYQLPITQQTADLIPINAFWRDFADWDGKAPFVSAHFIEATHSFSEMMLALGVLDLNFDAPRNATKQDGEHFNLTAGGPLIAFHQEIKPAPAGPTELVVSENFYRLDDPALTKGEDKIDKFVSGELEVGVAYGANVVVNNPTSASQKLRVLVQIPQGALPVDGSKKTESRAVQLEPYSSEAFQYHFYFPATPPAGSAAFVHYPAVVSREGQSAGVAKPVPFKVVRHLSEVDKTSWDYLSQSGSDDEVLAFLEKTNLARLDLEQIAWRCHKSAAFFKRLISFLEKHHTFSEPIYRYALLHNQAAPLREWLRQRDDFVSECGPWLESKLLRIDPVERRTYEHLEYSPLVNQRAHRLGAESRIANPVVRSQYQGLLNILGHKPALDAADQMSVVYYLFLQDRVEEALARFHAIKPEGLTTRLQYDYFRCVADFYEEQLADARGLANQYASYPIDRWRQLFAEVAQQLDEVEGKTATAGAGPKPDREKQQGELSATEPTFSFQIENRQIALNWKNLGQVSVHYYLMDPEFLFSASPFAGQDTGRFSIIKPTRSDIVPLPEGQDRLGIPLPGEFAKANVLVEVVGAGLRQAHSYHANSLQLNVVENYGRLEVRDDTTHRPVSKAYVKVYARLKGGAVRFFRDGYTDLRGKFDYASLNSGGDAIPGLPPVPPTPLPGAEASLSYPMLAPAELDQVERFAILVMSDAHGAEVREAAAPQQ